MFDFDVNKKNNLIFNGITKIDKENDEKLTGVVRDIIKRRMKILRFIDIVVRFLNHSLVLRVGQIRFENPNFRITTTKSGVRGDVTGSSRASAD